MADQVNVKDNPTPPAAKAQPDALSEYVLDRQSAPAAPAAEKPAATQSPNDKMNDLNVTPITTPGWKAPDAPPRTSAENNSNGTTDKLGDDVLKSMEKSMESSEGREDINQGQENILDAAKEAVGKDLWKGTKWEGSVNGGKLGAAVSVSEVLKSSGVTDAVDSASISGVEDQMKKAGFFEKDVKDGNPGDVVVYQPDPNNPSKRIGVLGDPNEHGKPTIYQMDRNGKWSHHEMKVPANAKTKVYSPGCQE
ncbi:MAG: hypothetical protein SGJ27_17480 [Candidatus Melainabacteria bacterium]|nr:hypothetical protein [Candidatus Melainabacteria bacterium]